jgi:hypothetical protein
MALLSTEKLERPFSQKTVLLKDRKILIWKLLGSNPHMLEEVLKQQIYSLAEMKQCVPSFPGNAGF